MQTNSRLCSQSSISINCIKCRYVLAMQDQLREIIKNITLVKTLIRVRRRTSMQSYVLTSTLLTQRQCTVLDWTIKLNRSRDNERTWRIATQYTREPHRECDSVKLMISTTIGSREREQKVEEILEGLNRFWQHLKQKQIRGNLTLTRAWMIDSKMLLRITCILGVGLPLSRMHQTLAGVILTPNESEHEWRMINSDTTTCIALNARLRESRNNSI